MSGCRASLVCIAMAMLSLMVCCDSVVADEFQSLWRRQHDRVWIGPEYWANPMEDWQLENGRLECTSSGPGRTLHLLTHQLKDAGDFETAVTIGIVKPSEQTRGPNRGNAGFELGIKSELGDYRSSLLKGSGTQINISADGSIVTSIGSVSVEEDVRDRIASALQNRGVRLRVVYSGADGTFSIAITDAASMAELVPLTVVKNQRKQKPAAPAMTGNIALSHHFGKPARARAGVGPNSLFWFQDWSVSGDRVEEHAEQTFGPVLYAMHTLSRGTMKMTAQMPPVGAHDQQWVELHVPVDAAKKILRVPGVESSANDAGFAPIARADIDPISRTAIFRIPNWNDEADVPYQLVYGMQSNDDITTNHQYSGTVRRDPVNKDEISVAGFTGNQDTSFPNSLLVSNVAKHDPDVLFFSGDQIYEAVGGFGIIRSPIERSSLNYLRKIYLWGWAFRDVMRDRPSIVIPDDHDVYQGNIWGESGKPVPGGMADHAQGGFAMSPDFVNAVIRTQCGHHPDPFDATPKLQGIDCFYGDMVYGEISFAVLEDRYFKSGPEGKVNEWKGRPDHVRDQNYDTSKLDKPGLALLGDRQLDFLKQWGEDYRGARMKCVLSQTIFCNLANYHGPKQEFIFADLDSNGWPQTGRDRAVDEMRKCFAFHFAGDQHLSSIVHHGIDEHRDANWSFCVPSIAAGYPRSWRPDQEGRPVMNRPPGDLDGTGDYQDAFGNLMSVFAIGNPEAKNRKPVLELLHDKASGYGIVRFKKSADTIKMECWKLIIDVDNPQPGDQFPGWPKTIQAHENYGRKAVGEVVVKLPEGSFEHPIVKLIHEKTQKVVYTRRFPTSEIPPLKVFQLGTYTAIIGDESGTVHRGLLNARPIR